VSDDVFDQIRSELSALEARLRAERPGDARAARALASTPLTAVVSSPRECSRALSLGSSAARGTQRGPCLLAAAVAHAPL
jgi:hypothetical protein